MDIPSRLQSTRTAASSSTARTFFSRGLIKSDTTRTDDHQADQPKGALGLTTLHAPNNHVLTDLIFVHGLNGGSESTWSKSDGSRFWPKDWLPQDDAFKDVRIHTFGYSSGLNRESVLNVQDFASSLLSAIQDSPAITTSGWEDVPLIFVGHSMGGLVIKKAYNLSCQNPTFQSVANRVRAIFFLATPHQGADIANTLSRILALVPGSRPFVNDLLPHSPVLQAINEEFPRYSGDLQLFSFYETRTMYYGTGKGLIVEKNCAVMNYPNERRTYLDANHRDVARFASPEDSNYLAVRNALATLMGAQRRKSSVSRDNIEQDSDLAMAKFLGMSDIDNDDVLMQDQRRLQGSGVWLFERQSFKKWRDSFSSELMWLRGRPGAGKSFLAGNVVKHLREHGHDCCSFFFATADNAKTTVNGFLRSMAFQMARLHPEIFDTITDMLTRKDASVDKTDHSSVWRQIYLSGILKIKLNKQQYWIIDAVDECKAASEIMNFLGKAQESWPLCIFITSRNSFESTISRANPAMEVTSDTIRDEDSNRDISLFLRTNIHLLKGHTQETRDEIVAEVLRKSQGCFLWANLMLNELRQVHTGRETKRVLASNPSDMNDLYFKILDGMSRAKYGKDLAQSFLAWATCSFRPLSTEELKAAILVEVDEEIEDIEHSVTSCCGNLVYIDSKKRLQLIHLTAKEFLTNDRLNSEFAVDKKEANGRLAKVCLEYLMSLEPKSTQRNRGLSVSRDSDRQEDAFAHYASNFLFQHVHLAGSFDDELTRLIADFLGSSSVLVWIEHIARHSDLQKVYQAGKTIMNFLSRRSQHTPPMKLPKETSLLDRWGKDLIHLVTKFSKRILLSPSSINHLIPAFCPPSSAIRKQFTAPNRGLSVHGLTGNDWDECLTTISYARGVRPLSSAAGPNFVGLGMSNGKIMLYDDTIFQEAITLDHKEPTWCLAFGESRKLLASAGAKLVRVWNLETFEEMYTIPIKSVALTLSFIDDDLVLAIAAKNNRLLYWDMLAGTLKDDPTDWTRDFAENDDGPPLHVKQPTMAAISPHQHLLAVIYRGEDILLWDLEQDRIHDIYQKDTGSRDNGSTKVADGATTVRALAFSAALDTFLLATTYTDGDLIVYDTYTGHVKRSLPSQNAMVLHSSPDGRTLAGADTRGNVVLYDFETLKFLYRISFDTNSVMAKLLSFTTNGQRLLDVRSPQCRIWQPTVLLRQDADDENSDTVSVTTGPQIIDFQEIDSVKITAVLCVNTKGSGSSLVFCGKEDGSVHVTDVSGEPDSHPPCLFVQTAGCLITGIYFDEFQGLLVCTDASSRVSSRKLSRVQRPRRWEVGQPLFDIRSEVNITHILSSGQHSRLLISSEEHDDLWDLSGSGDKPITSLSGSRKRRWSMNPSNPDSMICARETTVEVRSWKDMACLTTIKLDLPMQAIDNLVPLQHRQFFATVSIDTSKRKSVIPYIHIWDYRDFKPNGHTSKPVCILGALSQTVELIVGVYGDRLVYIDTSFWICSLDIGEPLEIPVRHFFIPNDWLSLVNSLMLDIGKLGEIVFVRRSELAVIKRGLEVTESGVPFKPRNRSASSALVPMARPGLVSLPGRHLVTD